MTNKEFRIKYMHEDNAGSYRHYDLTHEEYDRDGFLVTQELYDKWHKLWLKQEPAHRAVEDDLTYGQFRTFCVLSAKYGLGYYKHNPVTRLEMYEQNPDNVFQDYDDFVKKCVDELDKRFILFVKMIEEERNKVIDKFRLV